MDLDGGDLDGGRPGGPPTGALSPARAQILTAVASLASARAELAAAFPQTWRGSGANAYGQALGGLLHHAQVAGAALRAADAAAAAADREQEAARARAGVG